MNVSNKYIQAFESKPNYQKGVKGFQNQPNPKQHTLRFRLTEKQKDLLIEHCQKRGVSVSDFIRLAIGREIARTTQ